MWVGILLACASDLPASCAIGVSPQAYATQQQCIEATSQAAQNISRDGLTVRASCSPIKTGMAV